MPLDFLSAAIFEGTDKIPYFSTIKRAAPYVLAAAAIKYWSRGPSNTWERTLHGKVYIVTGATTQGMGTSVVLELAKQGAQLIFLTRNIDEWSLEWLDDLRSRTNNELLYMERCNLADLWEVRKFATQFLDNQPPRRLDGVIVMSGDMEPWGVPGFGAPRRKSSHDGLELQIATNFVGVFHLLDLLQPSFKAQPPDRDIRIIVTTCWLQSFGSVNVEDPLWQKEKYTSALRFFSSGKLQLGLCMLELQRRLIADVQRVAKEKNQTDRTGKNIKIVLVNPGTMRSTSLRNVISNGSVTMLILVYCILLYPILYLFTKSGSRGGQSILHAICSPEYEEVNMAEDATVKYVSDCSTVKFARKEYQNNELQKLLYDNTKRDILALEKKMAIARNAEKKRKEEEKSNGVKGKDGKARQKQTKTKTADRKEKTGK